MIGRGLVQELDNFFDDGLGDRSKISHGTLSEPEHGNRNDVPCRIRGTSRLIDDLVQPELFYNKDIPAGANSAILGDPQEEKLSIGYQNIFRIL